MTQTVLLIEIQVVSPVGEAEVLRFSDRAIPPMPPTDALRPNVAFESRIQEPPALRRMLFDNIETLAPSLGVGALTLANADRGLDVYEGYAWREIAVWVWNEGTPSAEATLVLRGLCAQPAYSRGSGQPKRVRVDLYDYGRELSKTVQTTLYAGSNDGGGILYEGAAGDLKDTPKPLAWGDLRTAHIPVPMVNPAEQAHQLHDGPVQGSIALFDRGDDFGLAADGDLVGAAFDAAAPAAAHWVSDKSRGLVKFNSAPVGQFTAGFKGDAAGGYVETAGPILARILAKAGVPTARISPTVAALASTAVMGVYAQEPVQLGELVRFVAAGAPAAVSPDREGVWRAIPWGPPAATADFEVGEYELVDEPVSDEVASAPIGEVRVGYGRVWRTFTGTELAPDLVGTDEQARLAAEYRWAVDPDAGVKARFPDTWRTVEIRTALRAQADAVALAAQLKALLALKADGKPRRFWRLTVQLERALAQELGQTAALDIPSQGLVGNYLLVGEEPARPRRNLAVWTVWG
jgi:hypothetical protein